MLHPAPPRASPTPPASWGVFLGSAQHPPHTGLGGGWGVRSWGCNSECEVPPSCCPKHTRIQSPQGRVACVAVHPPLAPPRPRPKPGAQHPPPRGPSQRGRSESAASPALAPDCGGGTPHPLCRALHPSFAGEHELGGPSRPGFEQGLCGRAHRVRAPRGPWKEGDKCLHPPEKNVRVSLCGGGRPKGAGDVSTRWTGQRSGSAPPRPPASGKLGYAHSPAALHPDNQAGAPLVDGPECGRPAPPRPLLHGRSYLRPSGIWGCTGMRRDSGRRRAPQPKAAAPSGAPAPGSGPGPAPSAQAASG